MNSVAFVTERLFVAKIRVALHGIFSLDDCLEIDPKMV
jgi:hypothetical protein